MPTRIGWVSNRTIWSSKDWQVTRGIFLLLPNKIEACPSWDVDFYINVLELFQMLRPEQKPPHFHPSVTSRSFKLPGIFWSSSCVWLFDLLLERQHRSTEKKEKWLQAVSCVSRFAVRYLVDLWRKQMQSTWLKFKQRLVWEHFIGWFFCGKVS